MPWSNNVLELVPSIWTLFLGETRRGGISASSRSQTTSQVTEDQVILLVSGKKKPHLWRKGRSEFTSELTYTSSAFIASVFPHLPLPSLLPPFLFLSSLFSFLASFYRSFLLSYCQLLTSKNSNWRSLKRKTMGLNNKKTCFTHLMWDTG